jgi:hypothetical protein
MLTLALPRVNARVFIYRYMSRPLEHALPTTDLLHHRTNPKRLVHMGALRFHTRLIAAYPLDTFVSLEDGEMYS